MNPWQYFALATLKPRLQQTVLACWDYQRKLTLPDGQQRVEQRRKPIIDTYRGEGRWVHPRFGSAYQGYIEIADFHHWQSQDPLHEDWYILHFDRYHSRMPKDFFLRGPYFIGKAEYIPGGMDWLIIPNHGDRSLNSFISLPSSAPSRWHPLPGS